MITAYFSRKKFLKVNFFWMSPSPSKEIEAIVLGNNEFVTR